jgi:hypothetical protein
MFGPDNTLLMQLRFDLAQDPHWAEQLWRVEGLITLPVTIVILSESDLEKPQFIKQTILVTALALCIKMESTACLLNGCWHSVS